MSSRCPYCDGDDITETTKSDAGYTDPDEVGLDFECLDCGGLFMIVYAPIGTKRVEEPDPEDLAFALLERLVEQGMEKGDDENEVRSSMDLSGKQWDRVRERAKEID
jgi:hypothetical protein